MYETRSLTGFPLGWAICIFNLIFYMLLIFQCAFYLLLYIKLNFEVLVVIPAIYISSLLAKKKTFSQHFIFRISKIARTLLEMFKCIKEILTAGMTETHRAYETKSLLYFYSKA